MQSLALASACLLFIGLSHAYREYDRELVEAETRVREAREEQIELHRERVRAAEEDIGGGPPEVMRCKHDTECGFGDCWRGFCEDDGVCQAYWTCT